MKLRLTIFRNGGAFYEPNNGDSFNIPPLSSRGKKPTMKILCGPVNEFPGRQQVDSIKTINNFSALPLAVEQQQQEEARIKSK